jgi:hypothetical protein
MPTDTIMADKPTRRRAAPKAAAKLPAVRAARPLAPVAQPAPPQPLTGYDLLNKAIDKGMSPEQIGQFMDLIERQRKAEAEQGYVRAMVAFKRVAPNLVKDARASFTAKGSAVEYDYATLGLICEKLIAALAEVGISHDWSVTQPGEGPDANMICTTCTLTHELGHSKAATVKFPADPTGSKNPLQAIGSAITYGERYSLLAVCGIAVKEQGDDDGRGAHGEQQAQAGKGQQQNGNAQGRPTTRSSEGTQEERHLIDGPSLNQAILAIKTGKYSLDKLNADYALTPAQTALVNAALQKQRESDHVR